jgi:hypothetical protein
MAEWTAPFHLTDKSILWSFYFQKFEVPDRWKFSVGESGEDKANRLVGIVEP